MTSPLDRFKSAYNAFMGRPQIRNVYHYGGGDSRPDRTRRIIQNERSIINSIYSRFAIDCALIDVKHVKVNSNGDYEETINDSLNRVLTLDANIDQTGRELIKDLVYSMMDEGCVALFPTDTTADPAKTDSYIVTEARVAKIVEWFPKHIRIEAYNENTGKKEQLIVEKRYTPILENPFYEVMNEPNSTLQRMIRVLNQLDKSNDNLNPDKLNLIIQLPYSLKNKAKQNQADERQKNIEAQLAGSKRGIAYIDSTEKIVQLNRPIENNLLEQYNTLKEDLFNQLGITMEILNGTADSKTMQNYYSRIIEPIMVTVVENLERKWISRTAQSQNQAIRFFRNPFKLVPVSDLAELSDKLTRNEIMTSNEIRTKAIGLPPSKDPKADQLINSNLNQSNQAEQKVEITEETEET